MARNDRFLKACRKEPVDCTPIWIMRQAGRYLEEYRDIRKEHSFLEMCKTPELAVEVTLQPIRRFELDAAIIFSDILLPLEQMGIGLEFSDGEGPVLLNPLRTAGDVERMRPLDPEQDLGYVLRALEMTCRELNGAVPLIGFTGAPFTLASYAIEGGGSRNYLATKTMMYSAPGTFRLLMEKLTDMVIAYLNAQIRHGAQAVQVFDSWVGTLSFVDYKEFVWPHMKRLFAGLDRTAPHIHFALGAAHLVELVSSAGGDVIGLDWRTPLDEAWQRVGFEKAVQGNLEPITLFGSEEHLRAAAKDVLARAGNRNGHVFNLGHGVFPGTPVDKVAMLVDFVHTESKRS
ncbi:MAG: hemE [Deltaproteobacteria bacterium]|nr:hemE [Deltaproteobacteria bacterium]